MLEHEVTLIKYAIPCSRGKMANTCSNLSIFERLLFILAGHDESDQSSKGYHKRQGRADFHSNTSFQMILLYTAYVGYDSM